MATIADVLVTFLRLEGGASYQSTLNRIAGTLDKVANAEVRASMELGTMEASLGGVGLQTLTTGGIVGAFIGLLGKSLAAFNDSEDTIARLAVRMRLLGNTFPVKELVAWSSALGDQLGLDDEMIAKLGAMEAAWGLNRAQIERLTPKLLDISVGFKEDPTRIFQILARASRGRTQGLIGLNIDPNKIKGDLRDIDNLITQIGASFEGTAKEFRETLPGMTEALKKSSENLLEAIGRNLAPVGQFLARGAIEANKQLRDFFEAQADFLHIPTAANLGDNKKGGAIGFKGDPEQTDLMRQTANNTKHLHDEFVQRVLGGSGAVAKGAFTQRDAVMAFGI